MKGKYVFTYLDIDMDNSHRETLTACFISLKEIREKLDKVMTEEEEAVGRLQKDDQEGEAGETLGFEIDAFDNIDYLLGEVISFIEENLGSSLLKKTYL